MGYDAEWEIVWQQRAVPCILGKGYLSWRTHGCKSNGRVQPKITVFTEAIWNAETNKPGESRSRGPGALGGA